MAHLTFNEKLRITAITVDRRRRAFLSRTIGLAGAAGARVDQLLIVPPEIRPADPSFWYEVQQGHFGLAGTNATTRGLSPFDIVPPSQAWSRSLHGFSWLRHMSAAEDAAAADAARKLVLDWIERHGRQFHDPLVFDGAILARRVTSWLAHSAMLLDEAAPASFDRITRSLGVQIGRLTSHWRDAPIGYPRLLSLTALLLADLSVSGRDHRIEIDQKLLVSELQRQILADGGHIGRNSRTLVDLLLDLLPLKECFRSRGRKQPPELEQAISRMLDMLRFMRLGDGDLARFNGNGLPQPASLATALSYAQSITSETEDAARDGPSGYVRLERGETVVVADCGPPPPLELAGEAQAGCLSFELCFGPTLILCNGGMPGSSHADWIAAARSTAVHNTLVLGERSSAHLIEAAPLARFIGSPPIRGPNTVRRAILEDEAGAIGFEASHDGYLGAHGVLHHRQLMVERDGRRIVGIDQLKPPRGTMRLKRDIPFSIHFHLAPGIECRRGERIGTFTIEAENQTWRLAAEGARVGIEESIFFATTAGPLATLQIVIRGATFGETEVRWALDRID